MSLAKNSAVNLILSALVGLFLLAGSLWLTFESWQDDALHEWECRQRWEAMCHRVARLEVEDGETPRICILP